MIVKILYSLTGLRIIPGCHNHDLRHVPAFLQNLQIHLQNIAQIRLIRNLFGISHIICIIQNNGIDAGIRQHLRVLSYHIIVRPQAVISKNRFAPIMIGLGRTPAFCIFKRIRIFGQDPRYIPGRFSVKTYCRPGKFIMPVVIKHQNIFIRPGSAGFRRGGHLSAQSVGHPPCIAVSIPCHAIFTCLLGLRRTAFRCLRGSKRSPDKGGTKEKKEKQKRNAVRFFHWRFLFLFQSGIRKRSGLHLGRLYI